MLFILSNNETIENKQCHSFMSNNKNIESTTCLEGEDFRCRLEQASESGDSSVLAILPSITRDYYIYVNLTKIVCKTIKTLSGLQRLLLSDGPFASKAVTGLEGFSVYFR